MLVGAGLMFVLMHGEVSAEVETDRCDVLKINKYNPHVKHTTRPEYYKYCKIRDLTCVGGEYSGSTSMSCVKTKGGIFK